MSRICSFSIEGPGDRRVKQALMTHFENTKRKTLLIPANHPVLTLRTHPANILTPCTGRKGLRANDGAAAHERRGVTPASAPLFVPDSDRLWKQTVRHGGLLHLQPTDTDTFTHVASEASEDQHQSRLTFTLIVDSLPALRSQRPPVERQMPSPHRPSEQAPANAVLLLQPLSTDSACQLLEKPLWLSSHVHDRAALVFSWKLWAPLR